ncbi:MAG: DNA repair protein RecN [Pseudomonadota bacterium]
MLIHIHIRNFAIIDELELELRPGMCVLTGETGAGKSIIVDALGLVLGDRADSRVIRQGTDRAEITVTVDISNLPAAKSWLAEHDLLSDNECILRRIIARDGRSRAYIGGSPVPLSQLKPLAEMLVDIHGQHEHQSLLRRDMQRRLLDNHAGNESQLKKLDHIYRQWRTVKSRFEYLSNETQAREARIDLLRYQLQELREVSIDKQQLDALEQEHQRLSNVERLRQGCESAYFDLYENDDAALYSQLGRLANSLDELTELDASISESIELLCAAQVQLAEAAKGLHGYSAELEEDPQRLEWLENQIALIQDLARKHRLQPDQLPQRLMEIESELDSLQDPDVDPQKLAARMEELHIEYQQLAKQIRHSRETTAQSLSKETTAAMQALGMKGGRFYIDVEPLDSQQPSPSGLDRIEFLVSSNPGQPLQSLNKIASGGELSRISLAIQMVAANSLSIPTLIFDEVDSGIGGGVAEAVGRQLHKLGRNRQVLCVTHLPQVAAQAHHHYQVKKLKQKKLTTTRIDALSLTNRVSEIARMLGGLVMTEQTLAHAEEMITRAQNQ